VKASPCCVFGTNLLIATQQKHAQSTELADNVGKNETEIQNRLTTGTESEPVKVIILIITNLPKIQVFSMKSSKAAQKVKILYFAALVCFAAW
jgi:hypothetical protein